MMTVASLAAVQEFNRLCSTIKLRSHCVKNRLFFAPMGLDLANRDGTFSDEMFDFYDGIIAGGCGMIILSNASVSPESILQPSGLRLFEEKHALSLRRMVNAADAAGTMLGIQLQHYGGQGVTTYTRGKPLLTPSAVPSVALKKKDSRYRVRAMDQDDIDVVIAQFATSARLAEMAGAKLIQLQASNGYLLGSFQSPATNLRDDRYGGDAIARSRLLIEVIQAVRAVVSPSIVLSLRLGVDDYLGRQGTVAEDFAELIPLYEAAGIDLIETSICVADTFSVMTGDAPEVRALLQSSTKKIRGYATVPVGFAGLIRSIEQAEQLLADGVADFVGMARALFADNDILLKTLDGRRDEINWCLWDGKCFKDKHNPRYQRVYCCVNPKYRRPE